MACTYRLLVVFQSVPTQVEGVKYFVHIHHEEEGNSPLTLEKSQHRNMEQAQGEKETHTWRIVLLIVIVIHCK